MPRATVADYITLWHSYPGTNADKTESFGAPMVFARQFAERQDALSDDQVAINEEQAAAERVEANRIKKAFEAYFASTPEGMEEGRWLNTVYWQWAAAGRPEKIDVGKHPARPAAFAKFRAEWVERNATGSGMSMTILLPKRQRYGRVVD
jgi:hypothetical protein